MNLLLSVCRTMYILGLREMIRDGAVHHCSKAHLRTLIGYVKSEVSSRPCCDQYTNHSLWSPAAERNARTNETRKELRHKNRQSIEGKSHVNSSAFQERIRKI